MNETDVVLRILEQSTVSCIQGKRKLERRRDGNAALPSNMEGTHWRQRTKTQPYHATKQPATTQTSLKLVTVNRMNNKLYLESAISCTLIDNKKWYDAVEGGPGINLS